MNETICTLAALRMHLFPVDHPDLPVCVGWHAPDKPCNGDRGKHPACTWSRASTTDLTMLRRMFSHPRNGGIDCGKSQLVVLDEDASGELDRLCADRGQRLPVTFTVSTGKGRHVYFRQPAGLPFTNADSALRGYRIDVRGRGGYVVAPGSKHATGRTYNLLTAAPVAPVPEWVAGLLHPPAQARRAPVNPTAAGSRRALTGLLRVVLNAPDGKRNIKLNWAAYRMFEKVRDGEVTDVVAENMLLDAATAGGLSEGECRSTIASARKAALGG
jgi:hypothetical protein